MVFTYQGIAVYVMPWYHTTYAIDYQVPYLFTVCSMCATNIYLVAGMIYRAYTRGKKPGNSGNTFARTLLTPNREQTVMDHTKP